jgi:hypothetical protein
MAGENIEGLTLEIIFNDIAHFVNVNQQIIVDIIRNNLFGNFWVPSLRSPVNIYGGIVNQPMDIISYSDVNQNFPMSMDIISDTDVNQNFPMSMDIDLDLEDDIDPEL